MGHACGCSPRRPRTETGEFMKSLLYRPLAWMIAIFMLPACWAAAFSFGKNLPSAFLTGGAGSFMPAPEGWAFIAGVIAYALWHRLRPPEFLYAFVHEFTHMAFALLTGKKVSSFEVNRGSGKVGLSGTNPVITLAPYFFPLLTIVVLLLGATLDWIFGYPQIRWATAFLAGLTLCLHVLMTLRALGRVAARHCARRAGFLLGLHLFLRICLYRRRCARLDGGLGGGGFIRRVDLA